MAARKDRRKATLPEHIITESELQMKELLRKQIHTNVTLESQLSQVKSFSKAQVYASATDSLTGQVSLEQFRRIVKEQEKTDELRQFGLTDEEISAKLNHDEMLRDQEIHSTDGQRISDLKSSSKQLKVIEQKIADKTRQLSQSTTFAGAKPLSRHEMDLEKAVTRDRDSAKVFGCLVTDKSVGSGADSDHPINHLDQIWKDVLSSKPTCRRRKRKRREAVTTDNSDICEISVKIDSDNLSEESASKSLHHEEEPGKSPTRGRLESSTCCLDHSKPAKCGIEPVPTEVIERYRLTVEQIKQLPRFQNYSVGTPTPTLYLKNLSPRVTEEDLVSLFLRFQKNDKAPVMFRLLRGHMKGQAFVTFDSVETATAALNLVNGYDFKGKPIIIAYGNRTESAGELTAEQPGTSSGSSLKASEKECVV